jgi:hypothetical protein
LTVTSTCMVPQSVFRQDARVRVNDGPKEFVGTCLDVLRLSGNTLWWRPDASTRAVLAALLPAD